MEAIVPFPAATQATENIVSYSVTVKWSTATISQDVQIRFHIMVTNRLYLKHNKYYSTIFIRKKLCLKVER